MSGKVVLAYSGGLDTSIAVRWIKEKYGLEVITVTVDVGQGEDYQALERKALTVGAVKHYYVDARKEFIEKYVYPAVKANALYQGKYPLSTALSRPLIAEKLLEVALKENAEAVAHGCSGKGNDQVRFEVTIKAKTPHLRILAPIREWGLTRTQEIEYAKKHGIPIPVDHGKPYSVDQNLWGRAVECGVLDDPYHEPPEEVYEWTQSAENAPEKPEVVEVSFEEGRPVALNGRRLDPVELVTWLNKLAGKHGIGRIDHVEDRLVGLKSREVYECPAAVTLIEAHRDLEKTVMTRHEAAFKEAVDREWCFLAYAGLWVDPLRTDLEAFINRVQERVTGDVKVKLYKGCASVVGRRSPHSLYDRGLIAYEAESLYQQRWGEGFVEIWGLPSRMAHEAASKQRGKPEVKAS
ncbi:MAG: argininosuccinate synthase [Candidatus Bathyarchaeia archaeon]